MNTDLSIKAKGISNRINNEIANLFNQSEFVSSKRNKNLITIRFIKQENNYQLDLPSDYPFKIPINIKYNGIDYKKSLFTYSDKIKQILKNKYYMDCLCCNTLLCAANWMPSMNLCHIINEMDNMSKIKKEIKIIIICDEIRKKYLCYFAEFEKYLI